MTAALKWKHDGDDPYDDERYYGAVGQPGFQFDALPPKVVVSRPGKSRPSKWPERHRHAPDRAITHYLRRKLAEFERLGADQRANGLVTVVASSLLKGLTTKDTIYPAITPDGCGGLTFFWVAGRRQVEIEISHDLSIYVRVVDKQGQTITNEERQAQIRMEPARSVLAEMSQDVAAKTPNWRDFFAG